ncbi:hypothetical protein HRR83_001284 [Exophiala dermatitidis]|uniref:Uncharacterized protein n=2 Tax=Exophiala dermatitidis TaxID=5970 RepID=H6C6U7_EXODN|nr:uncharacterized protein HMPREF1120_07433 [Exophiala dermatitidis NIH/UT8656]KAJ4522787.1 hypothetical protein HRR75_001181 [Exophiala dermatitidis]EHY59443.1 hypothetical protein HMPREF1120_07433 [Exophiala dermatitidis NIH/UT8656]KAJ4526095.1 hypothetical protein HRR74_001288 [Exophiala dermatitidis]KAJ4526961.1 hypothetical protein HRR73_001758 [Exophiala dermatitidis]KAJ4532675.1 hypothetical protein HRR76_007659 [Exophiala dermatitidis]
MFAATKSQLATYLLGVCPFSIAFLVFLNSTVSFVITDIIGRGHGVGDAVGSLGFADELVAMFACPIWGVLSDYMGLRFVCVCGYLIICLALALFVQAHNVYPQLLLTRLLFSLGGAAASTMVTAILPAVAAGTSNELTDPGLTRDGHADGGAGHASSPSIASELTITPATFMSQPRRRRSPPSTTKPEPDISRSTNQIAGFVGMFTGCGALIALMVFLPLPAKFQYAGVGMKDSLKYSFYIVAFIAFILAVWCFIGLRHLQETSKEHGSGHPSPRPELSMPVLRRYLRDMFDNFVKAISNGFKRPEIALGYLGGFVARASSVGISLFIPLLVNAMFMSSGLCTDNISEGGPAGLPDIKRKCPRAYIVAAELTGTSEMVALVAAPLFGYWSARASRKEIPLLCSSIAGLIGYPLFPNLFDPDGENTARRIAAFLSVSLIGFSQIGAIVCSLGTLSSAILRKEPGPAGPPEGIAGDNDVAATENQPLLDSVGQPAKDVSLSTVKGSVAGVYSFYGGAAILILTKGGGLLFDKVSLAGPFYIMAAFNAVLMLDCAALWLGGTKAQPRGPSGTT